jgi:hypothetical protein
MVDYLAIFGVVALILACLILGILKVNQGTFTYTLDDPYIHLALSDQIRHGHYGLSPGVSTAPSSSILYPMILAIASGTRLHPFFPLIINCVCLFISLALMRQFLAKLHLSADSFGRAVEVFFVVLMALCFNMIGVVFTGLEHSLQLATIAAIVLGITILLDTGRLPAWLAPVIVVAPLVRYESVAICSAALFVLAIRGHWKAAAIAFAAMVITLGGFSLFLLHLGLPPLPSSILVKLHSNVELGQSSAPVPVAAPVEASKGVPGFVMKEAGRLVHHLETMLYRPAGIVLFLILLAASVVLLQPSSAARPRRWNSRRLMSLLLVSLIGGHAIAGRFGWFERYEDYALLGTALIGCYLLQDWIRKALADRQTRAVVVGAVVLGFVGVGAKYLTATSEVPDAANNVYQQQFQMHRFVDDYYRGPVAVNDIGLVAYHNPYFVLDLFGLASDRARKLRNSDHSTAGDYRSLVENSGVKLVMIYDEWFKGKIPATWQKVGSMALGGEQVTVYGREVEFYATDDVTALKIRHELAAFQPTLPRGVTLTIY